MRHSSLQSTGSAADSAQASDTLGLWPGQTSPRHSITILHLILRAAAYSANGDAPYRRMHMFVLRIALEPWRELQRVGARPLVVGITARGFGQHSCFAGERHHGAFGGALCGPQALTQGAPALVVDPTDMLPPCVGGLRCKSAPHPVHRHFFRWWRGPFNANAGRNVTWNVERDLGHRVRGGF